MSVRIGIMTAPRKVCYLGQSLDSLWREHPDARPDVFAEPGSARFFGASKCGMHNNVKRLGCTGNWTRMAKSMLASASPDDWILLCEDDVYWRPGSWATMLTVLHAEHKNLGFLSAYCSMLNMRSGVTGWASARMGKAGWCGNLALYFKPRALAWLIANPHWDVNYKYLDYMIGNLLTKHELKLQVHMPSLVLHLGEHSTLMPSTSKNLNHISRRCYDHPIE